MVLLIFNKNCLNIAGWGKIKKYIKMRWLQIFDEIWCITYYFKTISNTIDQKLQSLWQKNILRNLFKIAEWAFLHIKVYHKCPNFQAASLKLDITSEPKVTAFFVWEIETNVLTAFFLWEIGKKICSYCFFPLENWKM